MALVCGGRISFAAFMVHVKAARLGRLNGPQAKHLGPVSSILWLCRGHYGDETYAMLACLLTHISGVQFEIEGTLINVMKLESFPSGFVKRAFIVRTDEMYPQVQHTPAQTRTHTLKCKFILIFDSKKYIHVFMVCTN